MTIARFACVAAMAALLLSGCGPSLYTVKQMPRADLAAVDDSFLCNAYASSVADKSVTPDLEAEVKSRGLDCADALERYVSDCTQLALLSHQPHPQVRNAMVYEVANNSSKRRSFRIDHAGVESSKFTIDPGQRGGFGVQTNPTVAGIGAIVSRGRAPRLVSCFAV